MTRAVSSWTERPVRFTFREARIVMLIVAVYYVAFKLFVRSYY